ncbi:hypothetical protein [Pseudotabrizicola sp. 4114]|uniref:hypothetical protein n=1 Tax=Pseudotabrizicola sp. 4114 TaxID=2817731 RepID=UPI00285AA6DE|nr:ribosomal protein L17 [Pseudorhodobacter sp. 4114]
MSRNRMSDLKDHLFAQLERLGDESLTPEQIATEAKRAEAIVGLADQITENAKVQLTAARLFADHGDKILPLLPQIGKSPDSDAK